MDISLESRPSPAERARIDTARAVWFPRARDVELREERLPALGAEDILVRAVRSAISHGTEMLVYRGQVDAGLTLDLPTLKGSFAFPIKYGYASVGRVEQLGADVSSLEVGDQVFVHHPHQSAYVVPASAAIRLSESLDPEAGVLLANVETALNIVMDARLRSGSRALVFGQGVVGLLVTQVLRRSGAGLIVAVDPVVKRRELAMMVGADLALTPDGTLRDRVLDRTDGQGADVAIEVSGNPAALNQAIDSVGFQGRVIAASWYGHKPVSLDLGGRFHRNRVRIVSSQVSRVDPELGPEWTSARRTEMARDLLADIGWRPLISHRFPIERAAEAYRLIDERPEETVQVLFAYV